MPKSQMNESKAIVGGILTEFGMIDSLLRSVYKQYKLVDPVHSVVRDGDLDKAFIAFLDSSHELPLTTKGKIYKNQNGTDMHLIDLMQKLRQIRNIAAHQTWSLVTGGSSLPIEAHGQAADSYVGSIDDYDAMWRFYADQFLPIFEAWNYGEFDGLK